MLKTKKNYTPTELKNILITFYRDDTLKIGDFIKDPSDLLNQISRINKECNIYLNKKRKKSYEYIPKQKIEDKTTLPDKQEKEYYLGFEGLKYLLLKQIKEDKLKVLMSKQKTEDKTTLPDKQEKEYYLGFEGLKYLLLEQIKEDKLKKLFEQYVSQQKKEKKPISFDKPQENYYLYIKVLLKYLDSLELKPEEEWVFFNNIEKIYLDSVKDSKLKEKAKELFNEEKFKRVFKQYKDLLLGSVNKYNLSNTSNFDTDDLFSEAIKGFLDAYNRYDPNKEVKLITYLSIRIKGSILDFLRKQDPLSRQMRLYLNKINAFSKDFKNRFGHEPSIEEILSETGITEKKYLEIVEYSNRKNIPLDSCVSQYTEGSNKCLLHDVIPSNINQNKIEPIENEVRFYIKKTLFSLSRERHKIVAILMLGVEVNKEEIVKLLNLNVGKVNIFKKLINDGFAEKIKEEALNLALEQSKKKNRSNNFDGIYSGKLIEVFLEEIKKKPISVELYPYIYTYLFAELKLQHTLCKLGYILNVTESRTSQLYNFFKRYLRQKIVENPQSIIYREFVTNNRIKE